MRSFYQRCFALEAVYTSEAYCVLESDSWTLALVVIPDETAARGELTVPPRRREEVPVKLAFEVASIEDLRTTARSLGGQVDPRTTEWDFRGQRHCDGVDPEGNIIQLLEPLTGDAQT
jgi:predicted enzyme related to lactoylglutathione lyase